MAISFELQAHSELAVDDVFRTIADLRSWDDFAGVTLVGPDRTVVAGDRIEVRLRVMRRDIQSGCVVHTVTEPDGDRPGFVDIRSVDGPFDSRMIGHARPTATGCTLEVEVYGIGRGAARFLEAPVDLVMQRWAAHQLQHLLELAGSCLTSYH